ncbi:hypothetical protein [Leptospira limi]|uniref:Glycosyltransferase RgtA/B/C/D-like domain-containing protein n=1 Tax=Leptospira limi TaxID=2950023 RepID=A0ABT3LYZ1_9LEPT|nr:hypothetical protein [Leptospira limi]MCW7462942.1 hypothetical protein [Leptospira limi]
MIVDSYPTMDGYAYYSNAYTLATEGKVDFYWPVGYSAIIALLMKLGISKLIYFKIFNVVLSSLTVVLGYKIANFYIFNHFKKIIIVFLLIFYPEFIFFNSLFWSETVFVFLFILSFYLFLLDKIKIFSVVLAISIFVKPVSIFMPLVLRLMNFFPNRRKDFVLISYAIIFIFHFPWITFNYQQTGIFGIVSNNGTTNLFIGNNQFASGHYDEDGLKNISKFPTDDLKENVLKFWITQYQDIPLLVFKKLSYLLFGMPSPWIWSIGIGTNIYSQLPFYLTVEEFKELKAKTNDDTIVEQCYRFKEKINLYSLDANLNDFTKAKIANTVLYAGVVSYNGNYQLLLLSKYAFFLNLILILIFLFKMIYYGIKRISLFIIPLYFLFFYCLFFGDFRFFLPAIPFIIIGNFLPRR